MEWLATITLICVTAAPKAGVSNQACEIYYRTCVERAVDFSKTKGIKATPEVLSTAFLQDPKSRAMCSKLID